MSHVRPSHVWYTIGHVTHLANEVVPIGVKTCHSHMCECVTTTHVRTSHVTYTRHTWEWVMFRVKMSHVTHENEFCQVYNWSCFTFDWWDSAHWCQQVCHVRMSHVTCHICERVMSHMRMSHVTYANESSHIWEWVMSYMRTSRVTYENESCHICERVMSHKRMMRPVISHTSLTWLYSHMIWLICICVIYADTKVHNHVRHMCDMTGRIILVCDMTRSHMWHDSFSYVTWLVRIYDMTRSRMWHDSFAYVTWLILMCDMTRIGVSICHSYANESYMYENTFRPLASAHWRPPIGVNTYKWVMLYSALQHTLQHILETHFRNALSCIFRREYSSFAGVVCPMVQHISACYRRVSHVSPSTYTYQHI